MLQHLCLRDGHSLVARFRNYMRSCILTVAGNEFVVFRSEGLPLRNPDLLRQQPAENVRMTAMKGAEIIFMPHVTGCLPSVMPGRGLVAPELWHNRDTDPVALRQELNGTKGRGWLMKWLPTRLYENGVYGIFTNPIGMDDDQVRNGTR